MERRPLSMWWNQSTWDLARAAYVAELDEDPPGPDTLLGWVLVAIETHAARSPAARAARHAELIDGGGVGFAKVHQVPTRALELIDAAIGEDRRAAGRYLSRSAWVREAVRSSAVETRSRHGGRLPDPPARLAPGPARGR